MAPTLLGEHGKVVCEDCQFELVFDQKMIPKSEKLCCPNCGNTEIDVSTVTARFEGDVAKLNREATTEFERWELIAFNNPETEDFSLKRIVGLPGESIEFSDGNVLVNGELVRRSLDLEKPLQQMHHVYLFNYYTQLMPERFKTLATDVFWLVHPNSLEFEPVEGTGEIEWIRYQHKHCYRGVDNEIPAFIDDSYGINQNISRRPFAVAELQVCCQIECSELDVYFRIHDGHEFHLIKLGHNEVVVNGTLVKLPTQSSSSDQSCEIVISTRDDQLIVVVDGEKVFEQQFEYAFPDQPVAEPLSIGGKDHAFKIKQLAICRDTYYFAEPGSDTTSWHLGPDEYFVVGDNLPASRDSRHWKTPGLNKLRIIGSVQLAH